MDFTGLRVGIALVMAVGGALSLLSSRGKPPEWTPASYKRLNTTRFMWSRDRVRLYGAGVMVFGLAAALYWGVVSR